MKTSPYRRKHRRRAFRRLFWLLVLATLLLLLWPRRVTLDGLNSPHAILLRADSGEVLAEKDADSTIYPASMTKMMTALLAIEANPDLDTPVTLPEEIFPALQAQNASLAGFQPGETATVRDLLYGAMLPSGAECCEALAREVSGSEEAFAARMNQKAAELGMTGTHFCNPPPARPRTCFHRAGYGPADGSSPAERDLPQAVYHGAVHRSGHQLPPAGVHDAQHPAEPAGRHRAAQWPDPGR